MLLLPPSLLRAFARAAFRAGGRAHRAARRAERPAAVARSAAQATTFYNLVGVLVVVAYWAIVAGWLTGALPD